MAPLIAVDGVSKVFDSRSGDAVRAVEGLDVEVGERQFVTLVGRSGCGKSTLLRMIAGLTAPSKGRCASAARPCARRAPT